MKQKQDCPLCEEEVLSDAAAAEYCALCGMIIIDKPAKSMKIKQVIKYFCSKKCYDKFKEFYAKSFMRIGTGAIK